MRIITTGLVLFSTILILSSILPVTAVPPLPAEFYGNVLIDGSPAPVGTTITAYLENTLKGQLKTEVDGFYGGPGLFDPRLKVNITEDELQSGKLLITFQINGVQASESILFEPGTSEQFDISTGAGVAQVAGPGQTPVPVQTTQSYEPGPADNITNSQNGMTGDNYSEPPQDDGNTPMIRYGLETDESFSSDDGMASVEFKKETLLFSPSGQFLDNITIISRDITALPPLNTNNTQIFTGYAYEITPERTYFNPEGTLSFHIPIERISDMISLNPQIYEYNSQTAAWTNIKTNTNQFTSTVSGAIYEAGVYGLFIDSQNVYPTQTQASGNQTGPLAPIAGGQASVPGYEQPPVQNAPPQPPMMPPAVEPKVTEQAITPMPTPQPTQMQESVSEPSRDIVSIETPVVPEITPEQIIGANQSSIPIHQDILSSFKNALKGPVGIVTALVILIMLINAIAYLVYTRWWLVRNP